MEAARAGSITRPPTTLPWSLDRRLLRVPIFAKALGANAAIVALTAVAVTWATTWHVQSSPPHTTHYEMMALFTAAGLLLTLPANWLLLHLALLPLRHVEATAREVQQGNLAARVALSTLGDPQTDRLAATLNSMLDELSASSQALQAYARRLQDLSGRVLAAQEAERVRIARELHDQTGQELTSLLIGLRVLRGELEKVSPPFVGTDDQLGRAREQSHSLTELARQTLDDVRRLALELRPKTLDDLGLVAALRWYADEWGRQVGLDVRFTSRGGSSLVRQFPDVEIALYRVVQEALTNAAKHARAQRVTLRFVCNERQAQVEVVDDGDGFEPSQFGGGSEPTEASQPLRAGLGLFGMEERMALVGGTLRIESAPGRGTRVIARVPLDRLDRGREAIGHE